jgi:phosphotransacetylase
MVKATCIKSRNAERKISFSKLAGVNTLNISNLDSANTYKLLKELNKVDSIGPIMLGLSKPVHIFSIRASVEEMVNMTAIAVIDAQEKQKRKKQLKFNVLVEEVKFKSYPEKYLQVK